MRPPTPKAPRSTAAPANFDRLAHIYRWLERFTFGPALARCRTRLVPAVLGSRHALVLGDGDGRALAYLLRRNPGLHAVAVDSSRSMLKVLSRRCAPFQGRLETHHADALVFVHALSPDARFDLVVTHFFLDCLDQHRLDDLVSILAAHAHPHAQWLLSEFSIPPGAFARPGRLLIALLYHIFGVLTGLSVRRLPDHAAALTRAGWTCIRREGSLAGLLTAELWRRQPSGDRPL